MGLEGDPDCPDCHGFGWRHNYSLKPQEPLFGVSWACHCLRKKQRLERQQALWPYVDLPEEGDLSRMSFESWEPRAKLPKEQRDILLRARNSAEEFATGSLGKDILVLYSQYGTGKTHLLVSIVRRAQENGVPAMFARVSHLLDEMRATQSRDARETLEELQFRYQAFPILCLDELGIQRDTGFAEEQIDHLVDSRYSEEMPTAYATNVPATKLPGRIADRIMDTRRAVDVFMDVESYRSGERWK